MTHLDKKRGMARTLIVLGLLCFGLCSRGSNVIADEHEDAAFVVQTMYIAYYGRPSDPEGFFSWVDRLLLEGWSSDFINAFGDSPEYIDRFGNFSTWDLINNLYIQLFNRGAEQGGLGYYAELLETGQSTLPEIAADIAAGANNEDAITISNKVYVAHYFTQWVIDSDQTYGYSEIPDAVAILSTVDHTEESYISALEAVDSFFTGNGGITPTPTHQTYFGTATMTVVYDGIRALGIPPQTRIYQNYGEVRIEPPLTGDDGTYEQNPFYFFSKVPGTLPGAFAAHSAVLYPINIGLMSVFQYWDLEPNGDEYYGIFEPLPTGNDNFNVITTEDISGYLPFCTSSIQPGAEIDISFSDRRLIMRIVGSVYDPLVQKLCTQAIDRFEIVIDAAY